MGRLLPSTQKVAGIFVMGSACIFLSACSAMTSVYQAAITGGKSSVQDKMSINLQSIGNPNPVEAVTYLPSNQNFMIVDAVSGGLEVRELEVTTGKIILGKIISTNTTPSLKSVVGDSLGNLWIFPQTITPDTHAAIKYDLTHDEVTEINLPPTIVWNNGSIAVVRDKKNHIYFPSEMETRYGKVLSLYRIDAKNNQIEGPFVVGAMPDQSLSLSVDSSDLIWANITLRQRPTYVGVTNYSSSLRNINVTSNYKLNIASLLPSAEEMAPGLAVLSDTGTLIERIPIGSHLGTITGIYPLHDKHIIRITGSNPNCFTKVVVLSGEWQGYVVLSLKDVVIPTLEAGMGNPLAGYNLAKDATRIFKDVYGGDMEKISSLTVDGLEQFMNQKENLSKKRLFLKMIKKIKPSRSFGSGLIGSSGVHTYCTNAGPLFQNAMAYSDQDWWTVLTNGNSLELMHVYFPNNFSLLSTFNGPEAKSSYPLSLPAGNVITTTNDVRDILVAGQRSINFLRHSDVDAPNP